MGRFIFETIQALKINQGDSFVPPTDYQLAVCIEAISGVGVSEIEWYSKD
jgi:hypothetical protein